MENKIDKYIDLAKQVHPAHVPFDKSEAETLLADNKCGTAQNFFKRFINYFGKHLIMTITSIIALILAGFYFAAPTETAPKQETLTQQTVAILQETNTIDGSISNATNEEEAPVISASTSSDNLDNEENTNLNSKSKTTYMNDYGPSLDGSKSKTEVVKDYDISELNWEQIVFNDEDWSFKWIFRIKTKQKYDKYGNHSISVEHSHSDLEDKYLIGILRQLEDSISHVVNISIIKSICNLEIEEYLYKLAEISNKINSQQVNKRIIQMVNLYANINRKFINNPAELMKIKTQGIELPKIALEKLGIIFTDSTISIPKDEMIINPAEKKWKLADISSDMIDSSNLPNKIFVNKNIIIEWSNKYWDLADGYGRLRFSFVELRTRQDFDTMISKSDYKYMKDIGLTAQSYNEIQGISETNYRKTCPLQIYQLPQRGTDPILYLGGIDGKKLFDFSSAKDELEHEYIATRSLSSQNQNDSLQAELMKQYLVYGSMYNAYKYKYLIPVNIQIPYTEKYDPQRRYITLWYFPNEEFMAALPEDIRTQLEKEISIASKILKGEIQPEEACEEVGKKESLLGLCNLTDKAIANLTLYPNPASTNINVRFDLLDKRYYKVMLTDAGGGYLKDLTDWIVSSKAEVRQNFDLSELQNGIYLMQIVTEKGEKLLSKFIVNK